MYCIFSQDLSKGDMFSKVSLASRAWKTAVDIVRCLIFFFRGKQILCWWSVLVNTSNVVEKRPAEKWCESLFACKNVESFIL